jgi:ElaB/YqjD/DUF883 family membrane-anchored ribosome-binding protein
MATSDRIEETAQDTREQIAQLRRQVEHLMSERVTPALADAAGRAEDAARQASQFTREQAEALTERVRDQPVTAVLVAAAAGFLLGRLFR